MMNNSVWREPDEVELTVLKRLLAVEFVGSTELRKSLSSLMVRTLDDIGSLSLRSSNKSFTPSILRVPVEGEATDLDGVKIHVLFHIVSGNPHELEIFKEDGSFVLNRLSLMQLTAFPVKN